MMDIRKKILEITKLAMVCETKGSHCFIEYSAHVNWFTVRIFDGKWDSAKTPKIVEFYLYDDTASSKADSVIRQLKSIIKKNNLKTRNMKTLIHEGEFIAVNYIDNKDYFDENGDLLLTEITGFADFEDWQGNAPLLTNIGRSAYFEGWKGNAPLLTNIGGSAYFEGWKGNAPLLTNIGVNAYFEDWQGNAPLLTNIGGCANFEGWKGNAPLLTNIGVNAYFKGWQGIAPLLNEKYIFSIPIGSRESTCKFEKSTKQYFIGCFKGNEEELIESINEKHEKDSIHYNQCMDFINKCNK